MAFRSALARSRLTATAGVIVLVFLALAGFYYARTSSNTERLSDRNLRELDRIGRAVENRVDNFQDILRNLAGAVPVRDGAGRDTGFEARVDLIAQSFSGSDLVCDSRPAESSETGRAAVQVDGTDLRFSWTLSEDQTLAHEVARPCETENFRGKVAFAIAWPIEDLEPILRSGFFDQLLLADEDAMVFLRSGRSRGLRLHELPPRNLASGVVVEAVSTMSGEEADEVSQIGDSSGRAASFPQGRTVRRYSSVEQVTVAGEEQTLFLQPVRIDLDTPDRGDGSQGRQTQWVLAGLVSNERLGNEAIRLEPNQLLLLTLLLVFGLLAVPFLRLRLIGPRERLQSWDVLFLGASFLLASGFSGIGLGALDHQSRVSHTLDRQLQAVTAELEGNIALELDGALRELELLSACISRLIEGQDVPTDPPNEGPWMREKIFQESDLCDVEVEKHRTDYPESTRYQAYEIVMWTDERGAQKAKWTPNDTNTARVSVAARDYFQRIRTKQAWPTRSLGSDSQSSPDKDNGQASKQYFLQSIESFTTGKRQAALSMPFCWPQDILPSGDCADGRLSVAVMVIPPVSVHQPVLPPGFEFAVIDRDGATVYHSTQERNLHENFFEATDDDPVIQSVVAARGIPETPLTASYMGETRRLAIRPVSGTPFILVVAMETALMGTVSFESLFLAAELFGLYALALLVVFGGWECIQRRRFAWVWPDRDRPSKHKRQLLVLLSFAAAMALQIALAEPHPSFSMGAIQAVGLVLVLSADLGSRRRRLRANWWRRRDFLGWTVFIAATGLLLWLHIRTLFLGVLVAQIVVTVLAARQVYRWDWSTAGDAHSPSSETGLELHYFHTAALLMALVVVGLLPGYELFRASFAEHLDLLVRSHQVALSSKLGQWHERTLGRRWGDETREVNQQLALAFQPFLCTEAESGGGWLKGDVNAAPEPGDEELCPPRIGQSGPWAGPGWTAPQDDFFGGWRRRISLHVPFVTEVAVSMRQLSGNADVGTWEVGIAPHALKLTLPGQDQVVSSVPVGRVPGLAWWVAVFGALQLFGLLAKWCSRRVFHSELSHATPVGLKDHLPPPSLSLQDAREGPCLLFVCTRSTDRAGIRNDPRIDYVDLMAVSGQDEDARLPMGASAEPDERIACIDFFDHRFWDSSWNEKLLGCIERLVYVGGRRVFLLTSHEASDLLDGAGREPLPAGARQRWTRLLGQFVSVHVADHSGERLNLPPGLPKDHRRWLRREYAEYEPLRKVVRQLAQRTGVARLSEDALIDQMREMAASHYRALWSILPRDERMLVAQLAAGAVVNPKGEEGMRHLLARRLLVRDPEFRLMNESFRRFINETVPAEDVKKWERQGAASTWQQIKLPILLGLGLGGGFLVATQQELRSVAMAIIPAAAAGGLGLLQLLSLRRDISGR